MSAASILFRYSKNPERNSVRDFFYSLLSALQGSSAGGKHKKSRAPNARSGCGDTPLERAMGIEPTYPAWKAGVLPLNYARVP